jgi:Tfp pilus assembly protein PilO
MSSPQPKAKRRYNSWFVTLPLLAGTLAFAVWFYQPTRAGIADMQGELEAKQAALADAASLPLKLQRTNHDLEEARAFVATWRRTAARRSLAAVIGELDSIVAAAGAKTTKIEPEAAVRYQYLTRVPLMLACEGTFPQVYRVLQQLEQRPQTIWIEDLHITQERKTASVVTCVLKLAMFTGQSNLADKTD